VQGIPLSGLLKQDVRTSGLDVDAIFDYGHYIRYADEIVRRLDGLSSAT
jgi:hypothetical protein